MNKSKLTQLMRRKRTYFKLSAVEQLLYHELVYVACLTDWEEEFTCSNLFLCHLLKVSEKTLIQARQKLIDTGFIRYTSQTSKRKPGIYTLTGTCNNPRLENLSIDLTGTTPENNNIIYYNINNINNTIRETFEAFHKRYPGIKRKADTELKNLASWHNDYEEVVPQLLQAIEQLIIWRERRCDMGLFVPDYPTMQKWINERQFEYELKNTDYYED